MRKVLILALAVLMVSASIAIAVDIPQMSGGLQRNNTSNNGAEHIDIIVRYFPNDSGECDNMLSSVPIGPNGSGIGSADPIATEGAVVVWSTQSNAILGRDVTETARPDCEYLAGVISEPGGIASGTYGRMRIYGWMYNVDGADSTDAISATSLLGTSSVLGQVGASAGTDAATCGRALEAGSGSDGDDIQTMIRLGD